MATSASPVSTFNLTRRLVIGLVIAVLVIATLLRTYTNSRRLLSVLLHLPPVSLAEMLGLVLLYVVLQGWFMSSIYQLAGFKRSVLYGICMQLSTNVVNTLAPVAGLSGTIFMLQVEKERGLQRTQTLLVLFLYYLLVYGIFLTLLLVGSLYVLHSQPFSLLILRPALILLALMLALAIVGIALLSHPSLLEKLLWRVRNWHILKDEQLTESSIALVADETRQAWQRVLARPGLLLQAAILVIATNASAMVALGLALSSSGIHPTLPILVLGYLVATLFYVVSITPSGIGVAESILAAVLVSFGVPLERAIIASLLYRAAIVVVPLILGLPSVRWLTVPSKAGVAAV